MKFIYECVKCRYKWSENPRQVICPKCSNLYVKWINYEEWRNYQDNLEQSKK